MLTFEHWEEAVVEDERGSLMQSKLCFHRWCLQGEVLLAQLPPLPQRFSFVADRLLLSFVFQKAVNNLTMCFSHGPSRCLSLRLYKCNRFLHHYRPQILQLEVILGLVLGYLLINVGFQLLVCELVKIGIAHRHNTV